MNISGCRKHCYWFSHKHFFLVQALYHSHLLYTTVTFQERSGNPGKKKCPVLPHLLVVVRILVDVTLKILFSVYSPSQTLLI